MSGRILEDTLRLIDDNVIGVHGGERGSRLAVRSLARSFGQVILLAATSVSFAKSAVETFWQGTKGECSNPHFPPCICWILLQTRALNFSQFSYLSFQMGAQVIFEIDLEVLAEISQESVLRAVRFFIDNQVGRSSEFALVENAFR